MPLTKGSVPNKPLWLNGLPTKKRKGSQPFRAICALPLRLWCERGIVSKRSHVPPPRAKPKHVQSVRLISDSIPSTLARRNSQDDVLDYLAKKKDAPQTVDEVRRAAKCSRAALDALEKKQLIQIVPAMDLVTLTAKYYADLPCVAAGPSARSRSIARKQRACASRRFQTECFASAGSQGLCRARTDRADRVAENNPARCQQRAREARAKNPYADIVRS